MWKISKIFLRTTNNLRTSIKKFLKLTAPNATSSIPSKEQNYIKHFFPLDPAISKKKCWGKVEETKTKDHGLSNRNCKFEWERVHDERGEEKKKIIKNEEKKPDEQ